MTLLRHRQHASEVGTCVTRSRTVTWKRSWRRVALTAVSLLAMLAPVATANAASNPPSTGGKADIEPVLQQMASSQPNKDLPVLVVRRNSTSSPVQAHGGRVRYKQKTANLVAADLPPGRLQELASDP